MSKIFEKISRILIYLLFAIVLISAHTGEIYADDCNVPYPPAPCANYHGPPPGQTSGCQGFTDCLKDIKAPGLNPEYQTTGFVGTLLSKILPIAIGLGGFLSVILIVVSGIQFITSSGNPESAGKAQARLIYAIIGFVVVALAFFLVKVIDSIFLKSGVV